MGHSVKKAISNSPFSIFNYLDSLYFNNDLTLLKQCLTEFKAEGVKSYTLAHADDLITEIANNAQAINPELYNKYANNLRKAIDSVYFEDDDSGLSDLLRANVSRFAAHKAYHATQQIRNKIESTGGDMDAAKRVINAFNRYQAAEYNTAVARTRTAKQFTEFIQPDNIHLFPNLQWIESRSVNQRDLHKVFAGKIWAKNDPFWTHNTPGSLWNCKCDWEETNQPATNGNPSNTVTANGLENNPALTGEVFTDNATYIRKAPKSIEIDEQTAKQFKNLQSLIDVDTKKWRLDYYTDNAGYLQTNRKRIIESELNKQEKAKFDKEYSMCQTLVKNGHHVVYRETVEGSFDIYINRIAADLKKLNSHNNIIRHAKKAINKQGAKMVVFEFEKFNSNFINELQKLTNSNIHGYFYITGENKIRTF